MSAISTYPHWLFEGSEIPDPLGHGERAVQFLRALKHPASKEPKQALSLAEWQERIVRRIYGPVDEDGERLVREVFLMIPRGNRKTSLAAALSILHLLGPQKLPGGQIIFAAADRKQSSIGFREAANIIREDRHLIRATKIYDPTNAPKTIKSTVNGSTLEAASSDGKAMHGTTPTFVLVDEIHAWRSAGRELWEALQSGMAKRSGGLTVIATTAGRGREGLAAERYTYARKVALGEIDNPSFLPIIFEPEKDDDWQDEALWHKVNPGLALGFHDLKKLRNDAKEALDNPAKKYEFQQYNLNIWHGNSRNPLFDIATYDARRFDDDPADLEGLPCWIGVDMATNGDTAAVVAAWLHDDGQITIKPQFFVPAEDLKGRADRDGVPYVEWRDAGLLIATEGPIIDPDIVEDHLRELCATFSVQEMAFDPHLARRIMQNLCDSGLPVVELRQAPLSMGVAIGDLERTVNGRLIRHDGHPVLRHHFDSVVASRNDTGLTRMHKGKKTDRIDGAVAAAMAVHRACYAEERGSIYDDPEAAGLFNF